MLATPKFGTIRLTTRFYSRCYYIALSFMAAQKWAESMALFQRVVVYANKAKNDKLLEGKWPFNSLLE